MNLFLRKCKIFRCWRHWRLTNIVKKKFFWEICQQECINCINSSFCYQLKGLLANFCFPFLNQNTIPPLVWIYLFSPNGVKFSLGYWLPLYKLVRWLRFPPRVIECLFFPNQVTSHLYKRRISQRYPSILSICPHSILCYNIFLTPNSFSFPILNHLFSLFPLPHSPSSLQVRKIIGSR